CGGRGLLKRYPLERYARDARAGALMRPWTQEIATQQAWEGALGLEGPEASAIPQEADTLSRQVGFQSRSLEPRGGEQETPTCPLPRNPLSAASSRPCGCWPARIPVSAPSTRKVSSARGRSAARPMPPALPGHPPSSPPQGPPP